MGVTVYINRIGYWFEDADKLIELLDANCNDASNSSSSDMVVVYDDEKEF